MSVHGRLLLAALILFSAACSRPPKLGAGGQETASSDPSGSKRCRTCHPAFYKKWATSHHGTALQPFTAAFAATLAPDDRTFHIEKADYRVVLAGQDSYIEEKSAGGVKKLPLQQVMGGKNTYFFLTPMERGRLQTAPLAYDIPTKKWYDVAASGVRMHGGTPDAPLSWTDPLFTFNTSCFNCHVSQIQTNYDLASDTYRTLWSEPGITCETCHGPGDEHVAMYMKDPNGRPADIKILKTTKFTPQQRNEMCAPCHAKSRPLVPGYKVTQRFYDHYDLVTLEDRDYYPDGRDLGENYTYTSWVMSPCLKDQTFDCIHCHTSSGRYKFATENQNGACLPCHQEKVTNIAAHSHHKSGEGAPLCISCHMPKTRFANMNRSDHSMAPPTPGVSAKYKSNDACVLCHKDKSAAWADAQVRKWHPNDYQKPYFERAALVEAARNRDWKRLPAMLAYIQRSDGDAVFQASLLRLLQQCPDERKWPVTLAALDSPSPLVRAAAAEGFTGHITPETRDALVKAMKDEFRLVRTRAAMAASSVPNEAFPSAEQQTVQKATDEFLTALRSRPDDFASHTNLGNYYLGRAQLDQSIQSFETALRLRPDSVITLVNASIAYSRAGRNEDAQRVLKEAVRLAPDNAPANLNLGLLEAELGAKDAAETHLKKALKADPTMAQAAYNLCVMTVSAGKTEGLDFCRKASALEPSNQKYAFSLGFYLARAGLVDEALKSLEKLAASSSANKEILTMYGDLSMKAGKRTQARQAYTRALQSSGLTAQEQAYIQAKMQSAN
jgi:tetratricopeptide (TPR) repeat protein